MSRSSVTVLEDVNEAVYGENSKLHFQWCRYNLDRDVEFGYRWMWSREGRLLPLRGGARIPSWELMKRLIARAEAEGWGGKSEQD